MRKCFALFLALVLCLGVTAAFADQTITVTGSGEALVPADTAVVSLGVTARDKDALKAQSDVNGAIAKIRETLTGAGFSAEDINTGYISLYAVYDYSGDVESITGYNATSTLSIRVTDMARTGEVIDLAFSAGANNLSGVSFSVSDDSEARAEALKAAVADAKAKAAVLAQAAGFGEMEIESITEGSVSSFDSGLNNFSRKAAGMDAVEEATVVQAAKICVSAMVTVEFKGK